MRTSIPMLLSCLLALGVVTDAAAQAVASPAPAAAAGYSGGDGSTIRKAIVVTGVQTEGEGVLAEQQWIRTNLPGASIESRGRVTGPPHYDVVTVKLATGERRDIHFDITAFHGK